MSPTTPQIPYLEITRHPYATDRLVATPHNHEWHDNASRMPFLCDYFNSIVLPNMIPPELHNDIVRKHFFPIEPHDSYSYLVDEKYHDLDTVSPAYEKGDLMSFARRKGHASIVLLPDIYFMCDWGGQTYTGGMPKDTITFSQKPSDAVTFYGSSTGARTPERNRRVEWCRWALEKNNFNFKITRTVQMPKGTVLQPTDICESRHVTPKEQTRHKFIMNIEGNTCRFDVWPLATNSLVFVDRDAKDELVYHPELKHGEHWLEVDMDDIQKMRKYYINNPKEAERITSNANALAARLFTRENCARYAAEALVRAASVF